MKAHLLLFCALIALHTSAQRTVGLTQYDVPPTGYMLFAPITSTTTYLIDACGEKVHQWASSYNPGLSAQLQPDGSLLRAGNVHNANFNAGGTGGVLERWSWDGNLLWSRAVSNDSLCQHHDFTVLPNGNILVIMWDRRTGADAIANGKDPASTNAYLWSERIVELQPQGSNGALIVWQWRLWDHLVQAFDANLPHYGVVADHPERLNINFFLGPPSSFDWIHLNSIVYNAELDQIMVSSHSLDELWIIDHSTTTEEAAGTTGGARGKGGDLLYRWGNPRAYERGTVADQKLFGQHHVTWLPAGHPDVGKILVFNNGLNRPGGAYTSVEIIAPAVDANGDYAVPATDAFGPLAQDWIWTAPTPTDFYSQNIGGVFPVDDGFLITAGTGGKAIYIDASELQQWEYVSPITTGGTPVLQGSTITNNSVFRFQQYAPDFAGFTGQSLEPQGEIELNPLVSLCTLSGVEEAPLASASFVAPNPASDRVVISLPAASREVKLMDATGRVVSSVRVNGAIKWELDVCALAPGSYTLVVSGSGSLRSQRVIIAR